MKSIQKFTILILLFFVVANSKAQDSIRFKNDVDQLYNKEYNFRNDNKVVVFAGSSSIRMWKDVQDYFPEFNVINNGFGGSHFSDLIYFYDQLILKQKPDVLFIYEGDNDIAANKKPKNILKEAKLLTSKIKADLPQTKIVIISPKPCLARVALKKKYESLNKKLNRFCQNNGVAFADVWHPMLDENGDVFQDIFIEDGLHMNKKGYDIWGKVISAFLE